MGLAKGIFKFFNNEETNYTATPPNNLSDQNISTALIPYSGQIKRETTQFGLTLTVFIPMQFKNLTNSTKKLLYRQLQTTNKHTASLEQLLIRRIEQPSSEKSSPSLQLI